MKILHVTDIHFTLPWLDWVIARQGEYDVIVISGDLADNAKVSRGINYKSQWIELRSRLALLGKPTFICGGNHDVDPDSVIGADHAARVASMAAVGASDLYRAVNGLPFVRTDGAVEVLGGYRFICSAFRRTDVVAAEAIRSPEPVILVSHVGPAGFPVAWEGEGDGADERLGDLAFKLSAGSLILCGHFHKRRHWVSTLGRATCLNPGNRFGARVPQHVVVDTTAGTAVLHIDGRTEVSVIPSIVNAAVAA